MKTLWKTVSFAALGLMFLLAILVFAGVVPAHTYRICAMVGTVGWFATVPFWMHRRLHNPPD